ncbi:MAG TPA: Gfo/Idh/MocA family oxidoreductase [Candidatus Glassbacteria bacterium]|nr:Gfo/Idh/MocA family oxidoreductase [Candidatus Glassbacteria bacterium]
MSPRKAKLTAALIGCGRIGWLLENDPLRGKPCTHAGALRSIDRVKIVATADPDEPRLADFGREFGIDALYPSHRELLERQRVDILAVAAPTAFHSEIVTEAADSGRIRGIYCEKPVSRTLGEADRMIAACERAGVALLVGHERRFGAHFIKARELVTGGAIGTLRTLFGQALCAEPPAIPRNEAGGGPLLHDGTHLTDLFGYFCGPADWVIGQVERSHGPRNIEHTARALVGMKNGAAGFIEGGGRRGYFAFDLEIQGEEGGVRVGNRPPELWLAGASPRLSGFSELTQVQFPSYTPNNGFVAAFQALITEIESGQQSISTGRDGRAALELILAIYESAARRGRKVRVGRG